MGASVACSTHDLGRTHLMSHPRSPKMSREAVTYVGFRLHLARWCWSRSVRSVRDSGEESTTVR